MSKLTIKSIRKIKNTAVWCDYSDNSAAICFARKTLIYGFNGTGKTTLSRILDSLRGNSMVDNLPKESEFQVTLSNGEMISSSEFNKPFGKNLLVFNSDFITRNIKWDESRANPIFYLSEENISKKAAYDAARKTLEIAITSHNEATKAEQTALKEHKDKKTNVARRVRDLALSGAYTQAYDSRRVETGYSEREYSAADILDVELLAQKQALLNQSEPLPKIAPLDELTFDLSKWSERLETLLKRSVSSDVIKQFEEHSNALNWIDEGLDYHKTHDLNNCLFCGN